MGRSGIAFGVIWANIAGLFLNSPLVGSRSCKAINKQEMICPLLRAEVVCFGRNGYILPSHPPLPRQIGTWPSFVHHSVLLVKNKWMRKENNSTVKWRNGFARAILLLLAGKRAFKALPQLCRRKQPASLQRYCTIWMVIYINPTQLRKKKSRNINVIMFFIRFSPWVIRNLFYSWQIASHFMNINTIPDKKFVGFSLFHLIAEHSVYLGNLLYYL